MSRVSSECLENFLVENQVRSYRLAYSYLKDREEALDAVQTAVCRALRSRIACGRRPPCGSGSTAF